MRGVVLTRRREVSQNVSRASFHILLVTAVVLLASIAGVGFPDGP